MRADSSIVELVCHVERSFVRDVYHQGTNQLGERREDSIHQIHPRPVTSTCIYAEGGLERDWDKSYRYLQ